MSQPCSLLELLLVDARDLGSFVTRAMLELAVEHAVPHGALLAERSDATSPDYQGLLDFWLLGDNGEWPFARAAAFAGVEEQRTLFVSTDPLARDAATAAGVAATAPDIALMGRLLP